MHTAATKVTRGNGDKLATAINVKYLTNYLHFFPALPAIHSRMGGRVA